jgi:hypothetical protein
MVPFNHNYDVAHLDDITRLETDFHHAARYRRKKRAFHFHGFHDGDYLLFGDGIARTSCQTKQLPWHQSANFTRTSSGFGFCARRLLWMLQVVRAAVKPYRGRVAIVDHVKAVTRAGNLDMCRIEQSKGNSIAGEVEGAVTFGLLDPACNFLIAHSPV